MQARAERDEEDKARLRRCERVDWRASGAGGFAHGCRSPSATSRTPATYSIPHRKRESRSRSPGGAAADLDGSRIGRSRC